MMQTTISKTVAQIIHYCCGCMFLSLHKQRDFESRINLLYLSHYNKEYNYNYNTSKV